MSHPLKVGTVSYDVTIKPAPLTVDVALSVVQNDIKITVTDIPGLSVLLVPKFSINPLNDIFTVAGALADIFQSKISDTILNHIKGFSKTVYTVNPITINDAGIALSFAPTNLTFTGDTAGMLEVTASLSIS